jgi:hypothetical protein
MEMHPEIRSLPVSRCIYCGATDQLSDEHIIPYSLNGNLVLRDASCGVCAATTGAIEQHLCDTIFQAIRLHQYFRSRGKRPRPDSLFLSKDGESFKIPASDHPGWLVLPIFSLPSFPGEGESGIRVAGAVSWLTAEDAIHRHAALPEGTGLSAKFKPDRLGRMLAKIAHSYSVLYLGPDGFLPFPPDIILDRGENIAKYVGGTGTIQKSAILPTQLHQIEIDFTTDEVGRKALYCRIRLFSNHESSPTYVAFTGYLVGEMPSSPRLLPLEDIGPG